MAVSGEWTVDGSAEELRALSTRLRATGQSGLKRNMAKAIRVSTVPARAAVKAELVKVMPKAGEANEYLAKHITVTSAVLTGPRTAGVVVRGRRKGTDWKAINAGQLRHPVFQWQQNPNPPWRDTAVPAGWWEQSLLPFGAAVREALIASMNATAIEAGFV